MLFNVKFSMVRSAAEEQEEEEAALQERLRKGLNEKLALAKKQAED
jgi:hypothetical protein